MPFRGFLIPTWVGYLCGFLFLQKPWGHPRFKSWIAFQPFWGLILITLQALVLYDMIRTFDLEPLAKISHNPTIYRAVHYLTIGTIFFTSNSFRLLFAKNAKRLAILLNKLRYGIGY